MSVDNTLEQLMARAILDLELLEALISRDSHGHASRNPMQHFSNGGRHSLHNTTTGRLSYYPRLPNLANGHPHHGGGVRSTLKRLPTTGSPASTIGYGGGWGSNSAGRATGGIQHKHAYERKQYQSKQPLGTGGNRANLGEKPTNKTPWPNRGGNFTDDVTDASEDDNSSQAGSESPYSVAKPAIKHDDACINKESEEEDSNDGNDEDSEKLNSKEQEVLEEDGDDDDASAKMNGGSNGDFEEKENTNNDENKLVESSVIVTSTIVTPGAMISPVVGGFGRSRRN
ncbi:hypothetical protein Mgra_00008874 [Meloidogyne graminicola]|uniref:Uncharacterized protein n=1 Tax=Meloidogyne graminicola TaxID=189291 RepID=A0A8S9ZEI4_9BILA|nr:hypothetical protein Mgra_00008874 [Meloidogyne graminicola]